MKRLISLMLVLVLAFSLAACGSASETAKTAESAQGAEAAPETAKDTEPLKVTFVGIMQGGMSWGTCEEAFMAACEELGWDGQYVAPTEPNDTTVMVDLAQNAITNGTDILIGTFYDAEIFGDICKQAKEAGVYVASVNCWMGEDFQDFWIGTEPSGMGVSQAKSLLEIVGDATCSVVYMQTNSTVTTQNQQFEAFSTYLADYPNVTVFGQEYCDSNEVTAAEKISNLIKAHPEINACVAADGNGNVGVCNYIDENDIKDDFYYVGIDAGPEVIEYLINGVIDVSVLQDFKTMGRESVMKMKALIDGETVDFDNDSGCVFLKPEEAEAFAKENGINIGK